MTSQQSAIINSTASPASVDAIRNELEQAQTMLFHIKMLQEMAFSAANGIDKDYKVVDYAGLLNEFLPRLQGSLDNLEKSLYSNQ
jgi:hypothetical protein